MDSGFLSNSQWNLIAPLISNQGSPQPKRPRGRPRKVRGRPLASDRNVLDGILYVFLNKIPWADLPTQLFPSYATCNRRYNLWLRNGTWDNILNALIDDFQTRTGIDLWERWSQVVMRHKLGSTNSSFHLPDSVIRSPENKVAVLLFAEKVKEIINSDSDRGAYG
jgi:transposase